MEKNAFTEMSIPTGVPCIFHCGFVWQKTPTGNCCEQGNEPARSLKDWEIPSTERPLVSHKVSNFEAFTPKEGSTYYDQNCTNNPSSSEENKRG